MIYTFLRRPFVTVTSKILSSLLRRRGCSIGRNVKFHGRLDLDVAGHYGNVAIGDNVVIRRDVELWTRGDGNIVIEDGVVIDSGCRLVAARTASLRVGRGTGIGVGTIINAGADVSIGEKVSIAGYCYIQASNHGTQGSGPIVDQPNVHAPINIGTGAWLGAHVVVLMGVTIGEGTVVAAGAVVNVNLDDEVIAAGVPAKMVSRRMALSS